MFWFDAMVAHAGALTLIPVGVDRIASMNTLE
jgi:hypothetical protein